MQYFNSRLSVNLYMHQQFSWGQVKFTILSIQTSSFSNKRAKLSKQKRSRQIQIHLFRIEYLILLPLCKILIMKICFKFALNTFNEKYCIKSQRTKNRKVHLISKLISRMRSNNMCQGKMIKGKYIIDIWRLSNELKT